MTTTLTAAHTDSTDKGPVLTRAGDNYDIPLNTTQILAVARLSDVESLILRTLPTGNDYAVDVIGSDLSGVIKSMGESHPRGTDPVDNVLQRSVCSNDMPITDEGIIFTIPGMKFFHETSERRDNLAQTLNVNGLAPFFDEQGAPSSQIEAKDLENGLKSAGSTLDAAMSYDG